MKQPTPSLDSLLEAPFISSDDFQTNTCTPHPCIEQVHYNKAIFGENEHGYLSPFVLIMISSVLLTCAINVVIIEGLFKGKMFSWIGRKLRKPAEHD